MELFPAPEAAFFNTWLLMSSFLLQPLVVSLWFDQDRRRLDLPSDTAAARWNGIIILLLLPAIVYSVFLPLRPGSPWFSIGVALWAMSHGVLLIALRDFRDAPMNGPVTHGIYRYSRHPIYLSNTLRLVGTGMASMSWTFLLLMIAVVVIVTSVARIEEEYCMRKYGDPYREYVRRTPRWIGWARDRRQAG
jgi:protein-S-isoprenylcysteine O-methyltransferase Ste14